MSFPSNLLDSRSSDNSERRSASNILPSNYTMHSSNNIPSRVNSNILSRANSNISSRANGGRKRRGALDGMNSGGGGRDGGRGRGDGERILGLAPAPSPSRQARRKWGDYLGLLLIKEIAASSAHIAPHGKGRQRHERCAINLNKRPSFAMSVGWKHVRDRRKLLLSQLRNSGNRRARASREEEEAGELGALLQDMLLDAEESFRESGERREAEAARQERLELDGEMARNAAMGRRGRRREESADQDGSSEGKQSLAESESDELAGAMK